MASAESLNCDDDSPPVCLVHINSSRLFQEITSESVEEQPKQASGLIGENESCESAASLSPSLLNLSPEVPRMGNSTPDKLSTGNTTSNLPIEGQHITENGESSFGNFAEQSGPAELESTGKISSEMRTLDAFSSIQLPKCEQYACPENIPVTTTSVTSSDGDQVPVNCPHTDNTKMTVEESSSSNIKAHGDAEIKTHEFEDETDDFDDRPLTVDVPQEPDVEVPVSNTPPEVCRTSAECSFVDPTANQVSVESRDTPTKTDKIPLQEVTTSPVEVNANTVPCSSPRTSENEVSQSELVGRESPETMEKSYVDITTITEPESTCDSPSNQPNTPNTSNIDGIAVSGTSSAVYSSTNFPCTLASSESNSAEPNNAPLSASSLPASEPSAKENTIDPTPATMMSTPETITTTTTNQFISPATLPIVEVRTLVPTSGTASISAIAPTTATITSTTSSSITPPLSLASQSTVQLMPFVATVSTAYPGPTTVLGNLAGGGNVSGCIPTAIPFAGAPGTGPGSLQVFNMASMPPFVGTPGIVLHATGPVTGNPGFQASTPIIPPSLSSVGPPPGLGGNASSTLNFLQPQQFATTLLPQSGTATDYLLDPQHALGFAQSPFPPNSIALFNPVNHSAVMESIANAPLSSIYPTFMPQPSPTPTYSQSMLSVCNAPSSTSFVSPPQSYRPSVGGGITSLVNATTPQMATTLGTGPSPSSLSPLPSMSFGASNPGGFLFQTANHPFIPSGPFLQSCQFPSYPVPFHNPDQCLPLNSTLPSNLSGFRTTDHQIETTVSSSSGTNLPQLWASSSSSSPFSSIPFCPTSFQPLTFPSTTTTSTLPSPVGGSSLLPQPPALQPCPALSKRLHRLCPTPINRGTTPTTTVSSGLLNSSVRRSPALAVRQTLVASTTIADKRPMLSSCSTETIGTRPKQIQTTPCLGIKAGNTVSNVGIRTPNSLAVIPSLRRRRPPARISSRPTTKTEDITPTTVSLPHSSCTTSSSSAPANSIHTCTAELLQNNSHPEVLSYPMVRQTSILSSPSALGAVVLDTNTQAQLRSESVPLDQRLPGVNVFPNPTEDSPKKSSNDLILTTTASQLEVISAISVTQSLPLAQDFDTTDKSKRASERLPNDSDTHLTKTNEPNDSIASVAASRQSHPTTICEVPSTHTIPAPETSTSNSSPSSTSSSMSSDLLTPSNSHKTRSHPTSPTRDSILPNGVQMRDNADLQASLERLDVSSVAVPSSSVNDTTAISKITTTIKDGALSRSSPLEATGLLPVCGKLNKSATAVSHGMRSSFHLPPPLLHHGPDDRRILTHYIDGHVIYESNKPFPVKHGMAVVEAALLHQCIEEEQDHGDRTSKPRDLHRRSSVSESVNGEEPMQIDPSSTVSPASSDSGRSLAHTKSKVKSRASRKSEHPENQSTFGKERQRRKPSPNLVRENGYTAERTVPAFEASNDGLSRTPVKDKVEPVIHPQTYSDHGENNLNRTKSLTDPISRSAAPLPPPSFDVSRPDRKSLDSQHLSSKIPISTTVHNFSPSQSSIPNTHIVSTNTAQSFSGIFSYHPHAGLQVPDPPPPGPVRYWTSEDVVSFVRGTPGCGAYAEAFLTNEIDGEALLLLAEDQFIQPPIGMKIGPALKLAARLETLRNVR